MTESSNSALRFALESLEWPKVLDDCAHRARSLPAKERIHSWLDRKTWAGDLEVANRLQRETREALELTRKDSLWGSLAELADPADSLTLLQRGGTLELAELALLRRWWGAAETWLQLDSEFQKSLPLLQAELQHLPDPHAALRILNTVLTPTGELSERATPRLAELHHEVRSLRREISQLLDGLLKNLAARGVLQDTFTDVRDGRYVLPVKISQQNEVEGILYEASASRQTVFIEPREVSPLNNRLRQKQNELTEEIYRILQETSRKLIPFGPDLALTVETLSRWDAIHARAEAARSFHGQPIEVTEERIFDLDTTAHPLLWLSLPEEKIIRNSLQFGEPSRTLMLTGPNTGGKTVLLKTLGLAGVFARTGFFLPARSPSRVPYFDSLFADLGDAQSIEKQLSSFSGHVLRFREILSSLTKKSLVLIDELNTATDPEEGAALGRAVLETLLNSGAMTVTTTHDPLLKALSVSDSRIVCASMAFDEASRSPTYRLLIGVPGRSRALETAERLGIPQQVLALARSYVGTQHRDFEGMLERLEKDHRDATRLREEAQALRERAAQLEADWHSRTQEGVDELLSKTRLRLRRIGDEAQERIRDALRTIERARVLRDLDPVRADLQKTLELAQAESHEVLRDSVPERKASAPLAETSEKKLEAGMTVSVPKWKSKGTVLEVLKEGAARVQLGALQMKLPLTDLVWSVDAQRKPAGPAGTSSGRQSAAKVITPSSEIDLRGMRYEEGMSALRHYLDQAYRSGELRQVTVIHGLGTGALREGCRALVAKLPYVKEFRDGGTGFGGTGATLVEFEF